MVYRMVYRVHPRHTTTLPSTLALDVRSLRATHVALDMDTHTVSTVSPDSPLWTLDDLSRALGGIPTRTIYYWRQQGGGPRGFHVGNALRFAKVDVDRWLALGAPVTRKGWEEALATETEVQVQAHPAATPQSGPTVRLKNSSGIPAPLRYRHGINAGSRSRPTVRPCPRGCEGLGSGPRPGGPPTRGPHLRPGPRRTAAGAATPSRGSGHTESTGWSTADHCGPAALVCGPLSWLRSLMITPDGRAADERPGTGEDQCEPRKGGTSLDPGGGCTDRGSRDREGEQSSRHAFFLHLSPSQQEIEVIFDGHVPMVQYCHFICRHLFELAAFLNAESS